MEKLTSIMLYVILCGVGVFLLVTESQAVTRQVEKYKTAPSKPLPVKSQYSPEQQLIMACFDANLNKVKELLAQNVNVSAMFGIVDDKAFQNKEFDMGSPVGSEKWTALLALTMAFDTEENIQKSRLEIAKLLIENKSPLDAVDAQGVSAFHAAIFNQYDDIALCLLEAGADLNTSLKEVERGGGVPPLMTLCERQQPSYELAKAMLQNKVDVFAHDDQGRTALYKIIEGADIEMLKIFMEASVTFPEGKVMEMNYLHEAFSLIETEELETVETFVRAMVMMGADIDKGLDYFDGESVLHRSINQKDSKAWLTSMLLALGAKVDVQDSEGNSPLHKAVTTLHTWDSSDIVKVLLKSKASTEIKNVKGESPWSLIEEVSTIQITDDMSEKDKEVILRIQEVALLMASKSENESENGSKEPN